MNSHLSSTVRGAALGAALVYWLDPDRGARRRAEARQKALHLAKQAADASSKSAKDVSHRAQGIVAERRGRRIDKVRLIPNEVLAERVRAELGRLCAHPGSLRVRCDDGRVTLTGPLLAAEHRRVLRGVGKVRGVRGVNDQLELHERADIPGLQGGTWRTGEKPDLLQRHWSPATRLLAALFGLGVLGYGVRQRGALRLAGLGFALDVLLRSLTNLPTRRLVGIGAGNRAVVIQKDLWVMAPVDDVFSFFSDFENFPRFMAHVRDVARHGDNLWRWTVTGPAGVHVSWDAELTAFSPSELIAWRSVPGSLVANAGIVRFEQERGGTRLDVRLSYNPPAGALGHAFASALGANPRRQLDEDLLRFKSLLEKGKATGVGPQLTREELDPSYVI